MEGKATEGYEGTGRPGEDPDAGGFAARFGERVRSVRLLTRLTADEVDRIAGVGHGTVERIESGEECDAYTALAVADAMGVTIDFLMDVGGSDPFRRYSLVADGIRAQRERRMARTVPVYRCDDLPREVVDRARPAFGGPRRG